MFESRLIKCSDSVNIYCRKYGHGEPVLMIHGACIDSDFFDETAEIFSQYYSVITYDRRGHGRSTDSADQDYSIEAHAEDAARIIRKITEGISTPCHVIANSAGCGIAMALAVKYPELIGNIMLHEPAIGDCLPADDPLHFEIREAEEMISKGFYTSPLLRLFSCEYMEDERARHYTAEEQINKDKNCTQFITREFPQVFHMIPEYKKLKEMNIFVGLGERSLHTYHARNCPELCKRINGTLVYFPGGHNCAFDLPKEFAYMVAGLFQLKAR